MELRTLDQTERQRLSAAGMRTFVNIARDWRLTNAEAAVLLGTPDSTYRRWKRDAASAPLDLNQLERLSLLLGIYKALQILLPSPTAADGWLRQPNTNPLFNGQAPLDRLLTGHVEELVTVRHYLDAERGGWA